MKTPRQIPRQRRRLKVSIAQVPAFTIDVSTGGFCAELMRVPRPGTPIQGSIRCGEQEGAYSGRVAWAHAGDARLNVRGRIGVQFTAVDDAIRQLLEQ